MALVFPLVFLLMISGGLGQTWSVNYTTNSTCALKGSTVNMSCVYTYPTQHQLNNTFWIMCEKQSTEIKSLKEYPEYEDRVEYSGRQNKTGILILNNITENDQRAYCFRITTDVATVKWIGQRGIQLNVSVLQVKAPQLVLEKAAANLTCENTCGWSDGFIWYKNGQALDVRSEVLPLQSSRSDSGRYSCAVRGHEDLRSSEVNISVMYPPQNTSVSVIPEAEVLEGDSVRLTCSSDSNPPALTFSWFQENHTSAVGSGQSFSISSFNSSLSGRFYCEAHNKYGSHRSHAVFLSVKALPNQTTRLCSTCSSGWNSMIIIGVCATVTIIAGFGILFIIIFIMHRRKEGRNGDHQDTESEKTSTEYVSESAENVGDASFQVDKDVVEEKKPEVNEIEYVSIAFHQPTAEARYAAGQDNDCSVIYSTVK